MTETEMLSVPVSQRAASVSSALATGGPVMEMALAFALFPHLLFSAPVYAQSPCVECFEAAQEELKKCLANAISQEDKNSCAENQQAQMKVCESGDCRIESDKRIPRTEVLPQTK
jgi:hypothetical protein